MTKNRTGSRWSPKGLWWSACAVFAKRLGAIVVNWLYMQRVWRALTAWGSRSIIQAWPYKLHNMPKVLYVWLQWCPRTGWHWQTLANLLMVVKIRPCFDVFNYLMEKRCTVGSSFPLIRRCLSPIVCSFMTWVHKKLKLLTIITEKERILKDVVLSP